MKRWMLYVSILVLALSACSFGVGTEATAIPTATPTRPPRRAQELCGDGVCDEKEQANPNLCPQDCPAGGELGDDATGEPQEPDEPTESAPETRPPVAFVSADVTLDREMGLGDCGVDPWRSEACQNIAPTKWWGQHLEAHALAPVVVVPDGEQRWVITNQPETVKKVGYDAADFEVMQASYRGATIDFSITPECSGEIEGKDFHFQIMGTYEDGQIALILSANPQEHIWGECAGTPFEQHPTHLLYGWAAAMSGDPHDLTGVLIESDRLTSQPGTYSHTFTTDTNPSPENRDHVEADLDFQCVESLEGSVKTPAACPWEK
jgi:hypothetical protein